MAGLYSYQKWIYTIIICSYAYVSDKTWLMFCYVKSMLQLYTCNLNLSSSCPISSLIFSAMERQCPHLLPLVGSVHENPHYSFPCCKWRAHTPRQLCAEDRHVILLSCRPAPGFCHWTPPTERNMHSPGLHWLLLSAVRPGAPLLCCWLQEGRHKSCASWGFCFPSWSEQNSSWGRRICLAWRNLWDWDHLEPGSLLQVCMCWNCLGPHPDMTISYCLYCSSIASSTSLPIADTLNLRKISVYNSSSAAFSTAEMHWTRVSAQSVVRTSKCWLVLAKYHPQSAGLKKWEEGGITCACRVGLREVVGVSRHIRGVHIPRQN